jgi:hypothetical protein
MGWDFGVPLSNIPFINVPPNGTTDTHERTRRTQTAQAQVGLIVQSNSVNITDKIFISRWRTSFKQERQVILFSFTIDPADTISDCPFICRSSTLAKGHAGMFRSRASTFKYGRQNSILVTTWAVGVDGIMPSEHFLRDMR